MLKSFIAKKTKQLTYHTSTLSHTTSIKSVPIKSIAALQAAIAELVTKGCRLRLEQQAAPRNYYANQYQRHLKRPNEIADYVIRVDDAHYDIGLLRQKDGSFSLHFDDYAHGPSGGGGVGGTRPIKNVLGIPHTGRTEHWAGEKVDPLAPTHSIAKLLQAYTKHATLEVAAAQGIIGCECTTDAQGNLQIMVPIGH